MSTCRMPIPNSPDWRDGFRRINGRVNVITGEMLDIEPVEVHDEDLDWWFASWAEYDLLEYKIRLAVLAAGVP